jgi:uridine kinase
MNDRMVISICGACGAGKSQLTKTVVTALGEDKCARVPTDYFLEPVKTCLADYLHSPIHYDWDELERTMAAPLGTIVATPAFDFTTFKRSSAARTLAFVVRPIMIVDATYPYPKSDLTVLLETPTATRKARIAERDKVWGTRVSDRWSQLEATRAWLEQLHVTYDLRLAGDGSLKENAERIVRWLEDRHQVPT